MRKKVLSLLVGAMLLMALSTLPVLALPFGSGQFGACQFNSCSITLSSDILVNLDLTPVQSPGLCTIQSGVASVLTDDSNGYTLTLGDNSTNTSLLNGSATIPAWTGTFASPSQLQDNSWGYRVDGAGSFGSGPTAVESNNLTPSATPVFAGIKPSNLTVDTIAQTSVAADPAVNTTIFYGACADSSVTPGAYTTSLNYSAIAN